jgi:hypothetical protein
MSYLHALILPFAVLASVAQVPPEGQLAFRANPGLVCHDERQPYLNFDLVLENEGVAELRLKELRAFVLDEDGNILERRFVARAPWLSTIGPGDDRLLYNPIVLASARPDSRIRYEMDYELGTARTATLEVRPKSCVSATALVSPIAGRVLVYDGHDFLSHHRRSSYLGQEAFGITDNFQRFAIDLMTVDAHGNAYTGDGSSNEMWFVWDRPVRAAGDGMVVAAHNGQPDNDIVGEENLWTQRSLAENEMTTYGNYVLIDHENGEFSLAAHLRAGSVAVRPGQRVRAGQVVGRVGNSGSSLGPHLHYELRNGWGVRGIRSLPPYFRNLRIIGTGERAGPRGLAVNTGDIVEAE